MTGTPNHHPPTRTSGFRPLSVILLKMANQLNNNCDLQQEEVDLPNTLPQSEPDFDEYLQPVRIVSLNCFKCGSTFPTQTHLSQHLVQKHKVFEYRCFAPGCEYSAGAM